MKIFHQSFPLWGTHNFNHNIEITDKDILIRDSILKDAAKDKSHLITPYGIDVELSHNQSIWSLHNDSILLARKNENYL